MVLFAEQDNTDFLWNEGRGRHFKANVIRISDQWDIYMLSTFSLPFSFNLFILHISLNFCQRSYLYFKEEKIAF